MEKKRKRKEGKGMENVRKDEKARKDGKEKKGTEKAKQE